MKKFYYLALGDSYTIGEMVPPNDNFPAQTAALLSTVSSRVEPPRIIARTGWTTDELEAGILAANTADPLRASYDFVTLLIGVNNQYRGRPVSSYEPAFEELLRKAIRYAGDRPERVAVLSIPDWGVTPFANGRDRAQIAREIDAYNEANRRISGALRVHYINITPWTRQAATDLTLLASDGLHPSAKEYRRWADTLAAWIRPRLF